MFFNMGISLFASIDSHDYVFSKFSCFNVCTESLTLQDITNHKTYIFIRNGWKIRHNLAHI